jgi:hypothetical protein
MTVCGPLFGCLLPQDDQVIESLPKKKNSPVFLRSVTPELRSKFYSSNQCANEPFKVRVSDDDLTDTMRSLWFVDKANNPTPYSPSPLLPPGTAGREITAPTSLSFTNVLANLTSGTHLLSVYVADSEFREVTAAGDVTAERAPVLLANGDTATDTAYVIQFTWVLDVEPCP